MKPNSPNGPRAGEEWLQSESNPFYIAPIAGVLCVLAAFALALVIYLAVQSFIGNSLQQAIRNADALSTILRTSPLYPVEDQDFDGKSPVNPLAVAIWIDQLKVSPPNSDLDQILSEENYGILLAALRYGDHCAGETNVLRPLSMPTVERIVHLGAFFAVNCATREGSGITSAAITALVSQIAAGKSSGSDLFKQILIQHSSYSNTNENTSGLATDLAAKDAQKRLEDADKKLKEAQENPDFKNSLSHKYGEAKSKVDEAKKVKQEQETALRDISSNNGSLNSLNGSIDAARRLIRGLAAMKNKGDRSALADPSMRAVEAFATALISSVEADRDVSFWRQALAAAEGWEQCAILALFFATASLMIIRVCAFRRHRSAVICFVGRVAVASQAWRDAASEYLGNRGGDDAAKSRQSDAAVRHTAIDSLGFETGCKRSPIVEDLVRAVKSDLLQINLYGLSDERVDKVAEDLKEKVEKSRQLIEWGVTTLPALGFLGTVRGILMALSSVGGLSQGDNVARLAALLDVSSALGVAFATTLLALVCMIVLSYCDIRQSRSETALVDQLRDVLNDKALP